MLSAESINTHLDEPTSLAVLQAPMSTTGGDVKEGDNSSFKVNGTAIRDAEHESMQNKDKNKEDKNRRSIDEMPESTTDNLKVIEINDIDEISEAVEVAWSDQDKVEQKYLHLCQTVSGGEEVHDELIMTNAYKQIAGWVVAMARRREEEKVVVDKVD